MRSPHVCPATPSGAVCASISGSAARSAAGTPTAAACSAACAQECSAAAADVLWLPEATSALLGSPQAFGFLPKAGPLPLQRWHPAQAERRRLDFESWATNATVNPYSSAAALVVNGTVLPQPPPGTYPGCQVWANHHYRFLFVRHHGLASRSIMQFFQDLCDAEQDAAAADGGPENRRIGAPIAACRGGGGGDGRLPAAYSAARAHCGKRPPICPPTHRTSH